MKKKSMKWEFEMVVLILEWSLRVVLILGRSLKAGFTVYEILCMFRLRF